MTTTTTDLATVPTEILKTDCKGRIRFPAALREELLDRFERSSMSGAEIAAHYDINYSTFASWRQKRERERRNTAQSVTRVDRSRQFGFDFRHRMTMMRLWASTQSNRVPEKAHPTPPAATVPHG